MVSTSLVNKARFGTVSFFFFLELNPHFISIFSLFFHCHPLTARQNYFVDPHLFLHPGADTVQELSALLLSSYFYGTLICSYSPDGYQTKGSAERFILYFNGEIPLVGNRPNCKPNANAFKVLLPIFTSD